MWPWPSVLVAAVSRPASLHGCSARPTKKFRPAGSRTRENQKGGNQRRPQSPVRRHLSHSVGRAVWASCAKNNSVSVWEIEPGTHDFALLVIEQCIES